MSSQPPQPASVSGSRPRSLLDPIDRFSQILYGVIMVLTFTGSFSAATAGRGEVRTLLVAALGCNLAWGLVDAAVYLLGRLTERGRELTTLRALRRSFDVAAAREVLREALPATLAPALEDANLERVREHLAALPELPPRPRLTREDWLGAALVGSLVFAATLPVILPFLFIRDVVDAIRCSHGIAVVMLFFTGFALGRQAGTGPWRMGLAMVVVGSGLIGITIALGG